MAGPMLSRFSNCFATAYIPVRKKNIKTFPKEKKRMRAGHLLDQVAIQAFHICRLESKQFLEGASMGEGGGEGVRIQPGAPWGPMGRPWNPHGPPVTRAQGSATSRPKYDFPRKIYIFGSRIALLEPKLDLGIFQALLLGLAIVSSVFSGPKIKFPANLIFVPVGMPQVAFCVHIFGF